MRPDLQNELSLHRLELIHQRLQLTLAVGFEVPEPLRAGCAAQRRLEELVDSWIMDPSSFIGPNGDLSTLYETGRN